MSVVVRERKTGFESRMLGRILGIRQAPNGAILATAVASLAAFLISEAFGAPLYWKALALIGPTIPLFVLGTAWTYKHYGWLALFSVLTVTQIGHVGEHVAQMVQLHLLHKTGPAAKGIFGALDIEWVHFGWNTWVLIAVVLLLIPFRRNPWLLATLVLAGWHEIEHVYIITHYIQTGVAGNPGLLAKGGAIGGGLPIVRPDLHMIYNLIETIPLVAAFLYQLKRSKNNWISRALPRLPDDVQITLAREASLVRARRGQLIAFEGTPADRFYVISSGRVELVCLMEDGTEKVLRTLKPGDYFGEDVVHDDPCISSARAVTSTELLALDRATMTRVVEHYREDEGQPGWGLPAAIGLTER